LTAFYCKYNGNAIDIGHEPARRICPAIPVTKFMNPPVRSENYSTLERFKPAKRLREAAIDAAIEMAVEAAKRRKAGEWEKSGCVVNGEKRARSIRGP